MPATAASDIEVPTKTRAISAFMSNKEAETYYDIYLVIVKHKNTEKEIRKEL
tara:strand:- start:1492 stop:1647 length:156 start_codon:yes stop_codon:yes gene_type:complete